MKEEKINEISQEIKEHGSAMLHSFLDKENFEMANKTLMHVKNAPSKKNTVVYETDLRSIIIKLLKFKFKNLKDTLTLANIAKNLELEKIAKKAFNSEVALSRIDSYYVKNSNENIIDWHNDISNPLEKIVEENKKKFRECIKFFFYLSDINISDGCLAYIPRSHHVVKALACLMIEKKIQYKKFWKLEDLRSLLLQNEIKELITEKIGSKKINDFLDNSKFIDENSRDTTKYDYAVKKGSLLIFNEVGVHRGAPAKSGRLVLRFFYIKKN